MERLKEIINRKPNRWVNLTIKEFERDISLLQKACKDLVIRQEYVESLEKEVEKLKKEIEWMYETYADI